MNNRPVLKNEANQKISDVCKITLQVIKGGSRVAIVFSVIHSLAVRDLLEKSFTYMSMKGSFSPRRKIDPYNSKPVLILAIEDLTEDPNNNDKGRNVMITKEDVLVLMRMPRQARIPPRSERIVLVATYAKDLVLKGPLLESSSTKTWMTDSGTIDSLPYRLFNAIVLNPGNDRPSLSYHQRIATANTPLSAIIHHKCDGPSSYNYNPPLYNSVNHFPISFTSAVFHR